MFRGDLKQKTVDRLIDAVSEREGNWVGWGDVLKYGRSMDRNYNAQYVSLSDRHNEDQRKLIRMNIWTSEQKLFNISGFWPSHMVYPITYPSAETPFERGSHFFLISLQKASSLRLGSCSSRT